ncbi:MAG TPA: histidine kinase [Solirubrobacteraceae bacterium]|jgi:signal transduction histidine kinase
MLLQRLNRPTATGVRLIALALVTWTVFSSNDPPAGSGRGLVVAITLAIAVLAFLVGTARPGLELGLTPDLFVMAAAGGVLCGASSGSAASVFVFVAIVVAGLRAELREAATVAAVGAFALACAVLAYDGSALGVLAYVLGFAAAALAAANGRQSVQRAEQAELLLAQTQRSREEQLRAARLQESTRIAREIHDVLAHALAGLTIQLEATVALIEGGAEQGSVLERVKRAHELAREGLHETRDAVGTLRGEPISVPSRLAALVSDYEASVDASAKLTVAGELSRLSGQAGQTVIRVAQEALTNVRKHAPGASVTVALTEGAPNGELLLRIVDVPVATASTSRQQASSALASLGGGYGLRGMRERAEILGGSLQAGPRDGGWQVELRLPAKALLEAARNGNPGDEGTLP